MASTCWARVAGAARTAALPPGGIASTIDGTTLGVDERALSRNCAVRSGSALGSTTMSVTPVAANQNGDTSRSDPRRRSASGSDASSVQYGAQASSGMSGLGGGGGDWRVAASRPPIATAMATTASTTSARRFRHRLGRRARSLPSGSGEIGVPWAGVSAVEEGAEVGEGNVGKGVDDGEAGGGGGGEDMGDAP